MKPDDPTLETTRNFLYLDQGWDPSAAGTYLLVLCQLSLSKTN